HSFPTRRSSDLSRADSCGLRLLEPAALASSVRSWLTYCRSISTTSSPRLPRLLRVTTQRGGPAGQAACSTWSRILARCWRSSIRLSTDRSELDDVGRENPPSAHRGEA